MLALISVLVLSMPISAPAGPPDSIVTTREQWTARLPHPPAQDDATLVYMALPLPPGVLNPNDPHYRALTPYEMVHGPKPTDPLDVVLMDIYPKATLERICRAAQLPAASVPIQGVNIDEGVRILSEKIRHIVDSLQRGATVAVARRDCATALMYFEAVNRIACQLKDIPVPALQRTAFGMERTNIVRMCSEAVKWPSARRQLMAAANRMIANHRPLDVRKFTLGDYVTTIEECQRRMIITAAYLQEHPARIDMNPAGSQVRQQMQMALRQQFEALRRGGPSAHRDYTAARARMWNACACLYLNTAAAPSAGIGDHEDPYNQSKEFESSLRPVRFLAGVLSKPSVPDRFEGPVFQRSDSMDSRYVAEYDGKSHVTVFIDNRWLGETAMEVPILRCGKYSISDSLALDRQRFARRSQMRGQNKGDERSGGLRK